MEKISLENLNLKETIMKESGSWEKKSIDSPNKGKFSINYSSILSKLILEAGKHCKYHASDLFIDWKIIDRELENFDYKGGRYIFGFREMGVDHNSYFENWLGNPDFYGMDRYLAVWVLDVSVKHNISSWNSMYDTVDIFMELKEVDLEELKRMVMEK